MSGQPIRVNIAGVSEPEAPSIDQPTEALPQRFLERLLETNRSFNLTAITDPAEAWAHSRNEGQFRAVGSAMLLT